MGPAEALDRPVRERLSTGLALAALCLLCAAWGVLSWTWSSGLVPDSVTYLDAARSLAAGEGLAHRWAYWDPVFENCRLPTATSMWPPGFPLAIAALARLGLDPYFAGRLLPVLFFAALPLPLFALSSLLLPRRLALLTTLVSVATAPVLRWVAVVMAELPFLFLSSLAVLCTAGAVAAPRPRRAALMWLAASMAAGGCFLLRYPGIACVAAVIVVAALSRGPGQPALLARLALAGGPSLLAVTGTFARNWLASGQIIYNPVVGSLPWPTSLEVGRCWQILRRWVRPAAVDLIGGRSLLGPELARWLLPTQVLLVLLMAALAVRSTWRVFRAARARSSVPAGAVVSGILAVFVASYLGVVIILTAPNLAPFDSRYVGVATPWCFILLAGWALRAGAWDREGAKHGWPGRVARLSCLAWVACQSVVGSLRLAQADESYVAPAKDSPAIAWIMANSDPVEVILTTRGADIAYWCPNPVLRLPRRPFSTVGATTMEGVDRIALRAGARYLVHFIGYPREARFDRTEFDFLRTLDRAEHFPERSPIVLGDAIVYRVGR